MRRRRGRDDLRGEEVATGRAGAIACGARAGRLLLGLREPPRGSTVGEGGRVVPGSGSASSSRTEPGVICDAAPRTTARRVLARTRRSETPSLEALRAGTRMGEGR